MAFAKTSMLMGQKIAQDGLIALLARIGLAATFWLSGQSKVDGLVVDILGDTPTILGIPHITSGTYALFATEYKLPLLPPDMAAVMAASAEHIFPVLLVLGLATRLSALALMGMTLIIQIFVYPDAWPVHVTWLTAQLYLITCSGGKFSLDYLLASRKKQHTITWPGS
jgi:Predicted membrane protein